MKKDDKKDIKKMDDQILEKLDKIIEKTRVENEALRKILEGLEKANNNSKGNHKK